MIQHLGHTRYMVLDNSKMVEHSDRTKVLQHLCHCLQRRFIFEKWNFIAVSLKKVTPKGNMQYP